IGHVMRKLLHLAFAVWKTGQPFDPQHYPWDAPAHVAATAACGAATDVGSSRGDMKQAAGHTPEAEPAQPVVTAACPVTVAQGVLSVESAATGSWLDFGHVKQQVPLARVLDHLGLTARLRGSGAQRRGPCPIHRGDGRGRTFSVNLDDNVYHCFEARCSSKGD